MMWPMEVTTSFWLRLAKPLNRLPKRFLAHGVGQQAQRWHMWMFDSLVPSPPLEAAPAAGCLRRWHERTCAHATLH